MKKVFLGLLLLGAISCGPTAEEKAKMDQAAQDSLKAAQDMQKAAEELAISQAQADTVTTDSTASPADSLK